MGMQGGDDACNRAGWSQQKARIRREREREVEREGGRGKDVEIKVSSRMDEGEVSRAKREKGARPEGEFPQLHAIICCFACPAQKGHVLLSPSQAKGEWKNESEAKPRLRTSAISPLVLGQDIDATAADSMRLHIRKCSAEHKGSWNPPFRNAGQHFSERDLLPRVFAPTPHLREPALRTFSLSPSLGVNVTVSQSCSHERFQSCGVVGRLVYSHCAAFLLPFPLSEPLLRRARPRISSAPISEFGVSIPVVMHVHT